MKLTNTVFVSPDVGNVKRAQKYANMLGGEICIIDKRRKSGTEIKVANIIGDVAGKNVLMVDDMITTAGTVTEACKVLKAHGAVGYLHLRHARGLSPRRRWNRSDWPAAPFTQVGRHRHDPARSTGPMRSKTGWWCSASPTCSAKRFTEFTTINRSARYLRKNTGRVE